MRILYGNGSHSRIDITKHFQKCDPIYIPAGDHKRAALFSDPCPGISKLIWIEDDYSNWRQYKETLAIMFFKDSNCKLNILSHENIERLHTLNHSRIQLELLQNNLHLIVGSLDDEYSEQLMSVMFIDPEATVLELGGNIGRNSCVIGRIINDSRRMVVMESDENIIPYITHNRDFNNLHFNVEDKALSKRKLAQNKWDTLPIDKIQDADLDGWKEIKTICWKDLLQKYDNLKFDTLVLDCEGAIYYILIDEPTFLDQFKLIIIENDFKTEDQSKYVLDHFQSKGFHVVYSEPGGWGPCAQRFYEVWKR